MRKETQGTSRHTTQANYDRQSAWYDTLAVSEHRLLREGLAVLGCQGNERVLEIGCGTGYALQILARRNSRPRLTCGLDLSMGMLRAARSRLRSDSLDTQVGLFCGDAATLPYAAGAFDVLFMSFVLELFADDEISTVLRECWRILSQGGRLAVVSLATRNRRSLVAALYDWAHQTFPHQVDCGLIDVGSHLLKAQFEVASRAQKSLWGLPVDIVVARKT